MAMCLCQPKTNGLATPVFVCNLNKKNILNNHNNSLYNGNNESNKHSNFYFSNRLATLLPMDVKTSYAENFWKIKT